MSDGASKPCQSHSHGISVAPEGLSSLACSPLSGLLLRYADNVISLSRPDLSVGSGVESIGQPSTNGADASDRLNLPGTSVLSDSEPGARGSQGDPPYYE